MLDVDQEDEDGDKARDTKLPQMLKVFVDFFFMIIQKISSGMLCSYNFHKHLLQCILPHVCPDVFLQCILPGRINFIYFLFILHEKLFDVLKVFFFLYLFTAQHLGLMCDYQILIYNSHLQF
jgi:hypothetical protein